MQPDWSGRTELLPGVQAASCMPPPFQWSRPVCGQLVLPPQALKVLLPVLREKLTRHLFLSVSAPTWLDPTSHRWPVLTVVLTPAVIRCWLIYRLSPGRKVLV